MTTRRAGLAAVLTTLPLAFGSATAQSANPVLSGAQSWTYQLQRIDLPTLAGSDYPLVVIDYSRDGTVSRAFSHSDIETLKQTPDGTQRIVLAYLSIGEAEDYRFYWDPGWSTERPAWLLDENPEWEGNYDIRYWDPEWQKIILGTPTSYLDRILAAGFDGVYLDRVDAFERADSTLTTSRRRAAMIDFVKQIADYARAQIPGFLIVPQNGEELLGDAQYRDTIDALAKEDLLYGLGGDESPNGNGQIRASLSYLNKLMADGKPVFLAEYLSSPDLIAAARADAARLDMAIFIGDRELDNAHSH